MDKMYDDGVMSLTAGGTVAKGELVKFSTGKVVKTTGATDQAIGIAMDDAGNDELVPVKILGTGGIVQLKAGGAITQGTQISAAHTATSANTDVIVGVALQAAAASDDMILVATQVGHVK